MLQMPSNEQEWESIANGFEKKWNFPHCVGALDGKHIHIQAPDESGSIFFNYKGRFSIVLMALVDYDYNFLFADVGCQGRISDGGVLNTTSLGQKLEGNTLKLPEPRALFDGQMPAPFVIVADDAFALTENVIKPYPGRFTKGCPERIFNYRLSRARRIVENAFGILSSKFRVFLDMICLEPSKVQTATLACIYLHNFLRRDQSSKISYSPPGSFDGEDLDVGVIVHGTWRNNVSNRGDVGMHDLKTIPRRSDTPAQNTRNIFRDYFVSPAGSVPWQHLFA